MDRDRNKQVTKISVFITSVFVIVLSITYAFINMTVTGAKRQVITAGMIDVILEEDNNNLAIENAMPTYDEVGMIQDSFTFRLTNNGNQAVGYTLKLVKTDLDNELNENIVRIGLVKNNGSKIIQTLSLLEGTRQEETVAGTIPREPYRKGALKWCQENAKSPVSTEEECLTDWQQQAVGSSFKDFNDVIDYYIYYLIMTNSEKVQAGTRTKVLHYWKIVGKFGYQERIETEEDCVKFYKANIDEDINNFEEIVKALNENPGFSDNRNKNELVLENGLLGVKETISYELRLWIDANVEDEEDIFEKTLSYKIDVEENQDIKYVKSIVFDTVAENLGENCKTYNDGIDTFLVGRCSKNYIWYSGKLWRVVLKNNETGSVKMVTDNNMTTIIYNEDGNSSFENSYMDQWLSQEFLPTLHDYEKYLVTDSVWNATPESSFTSTRLADTILVTRAVGLLNRYEYSTTFNNSDELATSATGYLNNNVKWLLITPNSENFSMWFVKNDGDENTYIRTTATDIGVRPSVNLKSNIQITSGDGTESSPYRLEDDSKEIINGTTLLSTRDSGEYVRFNSGLYRIVGVEKNLTKITAVNPPYTLSNNSFHSDDSITNFADASIKTDLESYYQGLDETIKNMIEPNTIWYLGTVGSGENYKASICSTVDVNVDTKTCEKISTITTASIGLPRYGEMFMSQITRGAKVNFWTLTPDKQNYVRFINKRGEWDLSLPRYKYDARPSMYLKSNVVIAKDNTGDGTYEHPYDIELGT